jgi:hypothetical protein
MLIRIQIQIQIQRANPVRIRILFRFCHHIRLDFDIKNRVYFMCQKSFLLKAKSILKGSGSPFTILYESGSRSMRVLVFCIGVSGIIQIFFFFQDGVGKRGRFIEPHWRNKGKGFILLTYQTLNLLLQSYGQGQYRI